MSYLSREAFLARVQRREMDYDLPDGARLRLRELMADTRVQAHEIGALDVESHQWTNAAGMFAFIVQQGVIDPETGEPLFSVDDIPALASSRSPIGEASIVRAVGEAIWRLSAADADAFRGGGDGSDGAGDADQGLRTKGAAGGELPDRDGSADGDLGADGPDGAGDRPGDAGERADGAADVEPVDALQGA